MAGQADGCFEARSQIVRAAAAGIEYQKASFIKEALVFRFPKRMMKIRRAIGNRLARQFPNSSSIFDHYLDTFFKEKRFQKAERSKFGEEEGEGNGTSFDGVELGL